MTVIEDHGPEINVVGRGLAEHARIRWDGRTLVVDVQEGVFSNVAELVFRRVVVELVRLGYFSPPLTDEQRAEGRARALAEYDQELAAMSPADRAQAEARQEIIGRHLDAMNAELDALKAVAR